MIKLGLTSGIHDTSASIIIDGKIIAVGEEERFNRNKHTGEFPVNAIQFCLDKAGISINDIDEVCVGMKWNERAQVRMDMRMKFADTEELKEQVRVQATKDMERYDEVPRVLSDKFGYKGKITFYDHYDCHAASCYFPSPFNHLAILILDGAGERASARIYKATETKFENLLQIDYPNSIGRFYGWITDYLGFQIDCDEGKIMGLAPYGDLSLVDDMRKLVKTNDDGSYQLDYSYFGFIRDNRQGFSPRFYDMFGPKRNKGEELTQHHKNVARAAQAVLEEVVVDMAKLAKKLTGEENLCLSGGVALNSVANGKILESGLFKNLYIYPAAGDAGTGIGAALYSYYSIQSKKITHEENRSAYLGYDSSESEILDAITKNSLKHSAPTDIYSDTAKLLAQNKIVGWFQDRAEVGPRALGNRSILANPALAGNKDRVNSKIKFRESFRPFAPSVLSEHAEDYFEMKGADSPYMIMAFNTRDKRRDQIPAVVHVDGSARVQVVTREQNEKYHRLIQEFYKQTGIPILLNTSFNRAGEVLVNTPEQAIAAFLGSDLDVLVIGNYLIQK